MAKGSPESKFRYSYAIVSSLTILVYCCISVFNVSAATSGGDPPLRADGRLCLQVSGGIEDMHEKSGPAGITYAADQPNQTIHSPFIVSPPFEIALYDADGRPSTDVIFKSGNTMVWAHQFKTGNNEWSETLAVTGTVDTLEVTLPTDHASTHVCILQSLDQTPTPILTNTATLTSTVAESQTPSVTPTSPNAPVLSTMTATATNTPLLLPTTTQIPLVSDTPVGQSVTSTPTSTVEAPTGLDPSGEPSAPKTAPIYLPLIVG